MLRLARTGLWRYYTGFALGRAAGIVVVPVVGRLLGSAGLGTYEVSLAVLTAATIVLDAGFGASLVRFVSDGRRSTAELLGAAMTLQVLASFGAIVIFGPPLLLLTPGTGSRTLLLIALLVFGFVEGYASIGAGLLRGRGQDGVFLALSVVRFVVTAGVATSGAILAGATGALFGVALGGVGFGLFALRELIRRPSAGTPRTRRTLVRYGLPLMVTTVMAWSLTVSDRIFLSLSTSPSALGEYAANYRIGSVILIFLAGPLPLAWIPVARSAASQDQRLQASAVWFHRFTLAALGGVVVLVATADVTVPVLFGSDFKADGLVIAASGVSGWLTGLFYLIATPILLSDETRSLIGVSLVVVACNVIANVALILPYGPHGAAVATLVSYLFLCLVTYLVVRGREPIDWLVRPAQLTTPLVLLGTTVLLILSSPTLALLGLLTGAGLFVLPPLFQRLRS